jgi:hypothetical protein
MVLFVPAVRTAARTLFFRLFVLWLGPSLSWLGNNRELDSALQSGRLRNHPEVYTGRGQFIGKKTLPLLLAANASFGVKMKRDVKKGKGEDR